MKWRSRGRCSWKGDIFPLRSEEGKALTRQKGSFSATSSFCGGKNDNPEFEVCSKTHNRAQVRTWNQNPQGRGQCSTFYSLFFHKWTPSHAFMFGKNTAGLSTKHPMAVLNNCHFLTTKHYFLKYSTLIFCVESPISYWEVLMGGSTQTPASPLYKLNTDSGISFAGAFLFLPTAARGRPISGSNDSSSWPSQDCQAVSSCFWDVIPTLPKSVFWALPSVHGFSYIFATKSHLF